MPDPVAGAETTQPPTLTADAAGMHLIRPQPSQEGAMVPPMDVTASVGLTQKDTAGRQWAILRFTDGTMTLDFRIPWQIAANYGVAIAQGLAAMQNKARSEEHSGLIVTNGAGGQPGQILIPGAAGTPR